eukprot:g11365.t2
MDPVALVEGALAPLQKARDAIQGVSDLKTNLRRRYGDYSSIVEQLKIKPEVISANEMERELRRLTELFTKVADLLGEYTAAPADGRWTKLNLKAKRAADYKDVSKELDKIDREVMRQLEIMSLKGAISSSDMKVLQGVDEKVDHLSILVNEMRPPTLPDLAAVPLGAIELTDAHISRASLLASAVGYLTNTVVGDAPCVLAGMAGGGKSFLASAVVRDEEVREHFRAGMFWWRVGRDAKDQLHGWLKGLALQVASTSGTTPPRLDSLEDVTRYLKAECGNAQRLVVLDDVWERGVVDALKLTGLQLLVTTRDRSVVSMPGECVEVGDMEEGEALEVLRVGCGAFKSLELPRPEALQVVYDCGKLPLAIGLAAPLLKGPPQDPKCWRTLHEALHKAMTTRLGTDRVMTVPARVDALLDLSMGAMADDPAKQTRCLFLAVLAPGTLARSDMLQDLWDEAPGATKTFAAHLVDQSMLQPVGDAFRVHDLVLHFLKLKLKANPSRSTATGRTVEHLGQLKVLQRYVGAGETSDGVYSLMALWRSVENLAEESHVAAEYTKNLDGVPDSAPWQQAGRLLELMGKYAEAEPLHERVLEILGATVGEEHPDYAVALNNNAWCFKKQGKYEEAGPFYERSLAIREKASGPDHLDVATVLNNQAELLRAQGKYPEAELLYERATQIWEKTLGPEHPTVATVLNNRALLWKTLGKCAEADPLFLRAIEIGEKTLGPDHPDLATRLNNRAGLLKQQGKYTEAEPLYERCQAIEEKVLGPEHPSLAITLNNRARLLEGQGKYEEAGPLHERSLAIREKALGPDHPDVATALKNRAFLLTTQGKYAEAEPLYERSQAIREKALGPEHPKVASVLSNRAEMLKAQGKYEEAESLYKRSLAIAEKAFGPDHPKIATDLNNWAVLLEHQGKFEDADHLYVRVVAILGATIGERHPNYASALDNRARLLIKQEKYKESVPLLKRVLSIQLKQLGENHPDTVSTRNGLAIVRKKVDIDIEKLLRLEAELKIQRESATSSVSLDAKVNMLKYLQVQTVVRYQKAYDALYYELSKEGGLECLRKIPPVRPEHLLQPKDLELQICDEDDQLERQLEFYLADAKLAKPYLDELVMKVAKDSRECEVQRVDAKSLESTRRKARKFCGGDVRKVADMARVTVICDTPKALEQAYFKIRGMLQPQDILRVANGFKSDWMPSSYRDMKMNPVVNGHLCEIQLQLRRFHALKGGQHAVYEWARELNVTTEMSPEILLENLSPEVTEEMTCLAQDNWLGTEFCLPDLHFAAARYDLAEESIKQELSGMDGDWDFQDNWNAEMREGLLSIHSSRSKLATVLEKQGKYAEAQALFENSLAVCEKVLGADHPYVASSLNSLASLKKSQGKYVDAEGLYRRSRAILEKLLGPDHPTVAWNLNGLAGLLQIQGKYGEAEGLYRRSCAICEKVLGSHHPAVAEVLHNLAHFLQSQGKYREAEGPFRRSLDVLEKVLGPDHPGVATSLNNLAELLKNRGNSDEAEGLFRRSVAIREKVLGPDHPDVATGLNSLALLVEDQGNIKESEGLLKRALAIREKVLGPDHPTVATVLNNLAGLSESHGNYEEAERRYKRSLAIREKVHGPDHEKVATVLNNMAGLSYRQGLKEEAGGLYKRSLAIFEKTLGPNHPDVATGVYNLAELLKNQGKIEEATPLFERSLVIVEKVLGPDHPKVASELNELAGFLYSQGKKEEAERLYKRLLATTEKVLGPDHPDVAVVLHNLAGLMKSQGNYPEAVELCKRFLAIFEKVHGPDHPHVASGLNNLAILLESQGSMEEAEGLYKRSLAIFEKELGPDHPEVAVGLSNLATLLESQGKHDEAIQLLERASSLRGRNSEEEHERTRRESTTEPVASQNEDTRSWMTSGRLKSVIMAVTAGGLALAAAWSPVLRIDPLEGAIGFMTRAVIYAVVAIMEAMPP